MQKYLNYEDNIFILNTRIKIISDLLLLEADADLFLDKTIEDIDFISATANVLVKNLLENRQLIEWDEQLHNLYDMEDRFLKLIKSIQVGQACFSTNKYPVITDTIDAFYSAAMKRQKTLKENMSSDAALVNDPRIVSSDELVALLAG
jgi:hypothetical protein